MATQMPNANTRALPSAPEMNATAVFKVLGAIIHGECVAAMGGW